MNAAAPGARTRLWEVEHPYQGAPGVTEDAEFQFDSFAELRAAVDQLPDDGTAIVYSWDWNDKANLDGSMPREFTVFLLNVDESHLSVYFCPTSRDQEPEIADWLRGPRVLGVLRRWWAPLLDATEAPGSDDAGTAS